MKTLHEVIKTLPQIGKLEHIGLRNSHRGEVKSVMQTKTLSGLGLEGDHRTQNKAPNSESKRQVTLMQAEHLTTVASLLGQKSIDPSLTRRNLVISGINLLALKDKTFFIGEVLLEYTGPCHPCTRMEEAFGPGGYNAMCGHGGITARVLSEGVIQLGDKVCVQ